MPLKGIFPMRRLVTDLKPSIHWLRPRLLVFRRSPLAIRAYSPYPKEGVFQPDSPPRNAQNFQYPTNLNSEQQHGPLPPPISPPRRSWRPRWWMVLLAAVFVGEGIIVARNASYRIFTPDPAVPGSPEDLEELDALGEELDDLLLVQQLRGAWRIGEDGKQVPVWEEWTAYEGFNDEQGRRSERLTTGPLRGSAGIAAQRVFWNEERQQLFLFVNFGGATTGWPMTVHGGAIATICDEALGRVAIKSSEEQTAVTANLEISYLDKVEPGMWYVMFAGPDSEQESTSNKFFLRGVLSCCSEDAPSVDGDILSGVHPHVTATGLFVVPKGVKLSSVPEHF